MSKLLRVSAAGNRGHHSIAATATWGTVKFLHCRPDLML
jgi:hypothetical protein